MSSLSSLLRGLTVAMLAGSLMLTLQSCSIGPRVATEVIVVQPGTPVQILKQTRVDCRILGSEKHGMVDITGWVAVRPDDFNAWMADYLDLQSQVKQLVERGAQ